jgi:hypothetical protein
MADEENNKVIELGLYRGETEGDKKELWKEFEVLDADKNPTGEVKWYSFKNSTLLVGSMYRVPVERKDGKVLITSSEIRFAGLHPDSELREHLRCQQMLFKTEREQLKLQEKYKNGNGLPDDWDELKRLYDRTPYGLKGVFENLLIAKLRRHKVK